MIEFNEIVELCKAEALANKFEPTQLSVWENICRQYSKKFFTPLHEVMKLDPEFVIRQNYAEQLDDVDLDEHLETLDDALHELEDPNWNAAAEKEEQRLAEEAEHQEAERVKAGISVQDFYKKRKAARAQPKAEPAKEQEPIKSGAANLSGLDEENER